MFTTLYAQIVTNKATRTSAETMKVYAQIQSADVYCYFISEPGGRRRRPNDPLLQPRSRTPLGEQSNNLSSHTHVGNFDCTGDLIRQFESVWSQRSICVLCAYLRPLTLFSHLQSRALFRALVLFPTQRPRVGSIGLDEDRSPPLESASSVLFSVGPRVPLPSTEQRPWFRVRSPYRSGCFTTDALSPAWLSRADPSRLVYSRLGDSFSFVEMNCAHRCSYSLTDMSPTKIKIARYNLASFWTSAPTTWDVIAIMMISYLLLITLLKQAGSVPCSAIAGLHKLLLLINAKACTCPITSITVIMIAIGSTNTYNRRSRTSISSLKIMIDALGICGALRSARLINVVLHKAHIVHSFGVDTRIHFRDLSDLWSYSGIVNVCRSRTSSLCQEQ